MLQSFINWFDGLFTKKNKDNDNIFIKFVLDKNKTTTFEYNMPIGQEEVFSELLFDINAGIFLPFILEVISCKSAREGKEESCQKVINQLHQMYTEQKEKLEHQEECDMDESVISPTDVFNNNNNDNEE